ncbi:fungal-specific transcription factor domain-containing protein [Dendryphion nanum]|uniref:Fungal-specific transcription factor domain-containing protein n=1 Tax=Dendryphion nanum TaxID=256645 RepID=A0A9P9IJ28_9PLEO|nr:fungal-specific transcription factor domain-containing protein [Dendryphion nanum]
MTMSPAVADAGSSRSNKRRTRQDDADCTSPADGSGLATAPKRRAFLQTMGQQLREFGNEAASPQNLARTTFGTSPASHTGPSSGLGPVSGVDQLRSAPIDTPESDAAPGEDDQVMEGALPSASKCLWGTNELLPAIPSGQEPSSFTFEQLLDWSQSYFDNWHPAFPFLHAPAILDQFRKIAQASHGSQVVSELPDAAIFHQIVLRSIMSISAVDRRHKKESSPEGHSQLVFPTLNDAISSVQTVLTAEASIISLQALVSVQLFLISMHRYNAASRLEGLAVRMAFQLGLHRCPVRNSNITEKEAELRKRLFWCIFCIDRYVCIRLGTPLGIRSDEFDVCFPHAERHRHNQENDRAVRDDRLDLLEFLARHAEIRGSIMESRSKIVMDKTYNDTDRLLDIDAEHTKWWNTVDEYLSDQDQCYKITKAHRVTLVVLRFETVLALHRSVLATSNKSSAYNAALQRCISASRSIINTLYKALNGVGAFDGSPGDRGYEPTPLLWPSFTWAIWMSAFIVIFAATEDQVSRDVAARLASRSVAVLRHLALRGTSWPDACTIAIQNLAARLNGGSTRSTTTEHQPLLNVNERDSAPTVWHGDSGLPQNRPSLHSDLGPLDAGRVRLRGHAASSLTTPSTQTLTSIPYQAPHFPQSHFTSSSTQPPNLDAFTFSNGTGDQDIHMQRSTHVASTHLAGSGTFLGIAQQFSDNPIPNEEIMHLFNNEDLSFWMGGNVAFDGL